MGEGNAGRTDAGKNKSPRRSFCRANVDSAATAGVARTRVHEHKAHRKLALGYSVVGRLGLPDGWKKTRRTVSCHRCLGLWVAKRKGRSNKPQSTARETATGWPTWRPGRPQHKHAVALAGRLECPKTTGVFVASLSIAGVLRRAEAHLGAFCGQGSAASLRAGRLRSGRRRRASSNRPQTTAGWAGLPCACAVLVGAKGLSASAASPHDDSSGRRQERSGARAQQARNGSGGVCWTPATPARPRAMRSGTRWHERNQGV